MSLGLEDFATACFDSQTPRFRKMPARSEVYDLIDDVEGDYFSRTGEDPIKEERVIEGVTFTDGYRKVGYTYFLLDGMLYVNFWDEKNEKNLRLYEKVIETSEDFEKALKNVDSKIKRRKL